MVAGVIGNIVQTKGFLFSTKPIEPKFSKILPKFGQYLKKTIFSSTELENTSFKMSNTREAIFDNYKDAFTVCNCLYNSLNCTDCLCEQEKREI